ncbi:hypothetical protein JCM16496A_21160 [Bacteroides rodentium JCM 16496]
MEISRDGLHDNLSGAEIKLRFIKRVYNDEANNQDEHHGDTNFEIFLLFPAVKGDGQRYYC